jgi:dTDP-4-dehydrorhamnose reductase
LKLTPIGSEIRKIAAALGFQPFAPWPLDPRWHPTHRHWHHDRHGEAGSPKLLAEVLYRNPGRVLAVCRGSGK